MGIWQYGARFFGHRAHAHTGGSLGVDMGELRGTHVPVLLERCLELLAPALDRPTPTVHVDATLGLAGHAEAVLTTYPNTVLIGLDRDLEALTHARSRLGRFGDRTHL